MLASQELKELVTIYYRMTMSAINKAWFFFFFFFFSFVRWKLQSPR